MDFGFSRINSPEYEQLWDAFYDRFQFAPSGGQPIPVIEDPIPSVTLDLGPIFRELDDPSAAGVDELQDAAQRAFVAAFGPEVELIVLDWQHDAWRIRHLETFRSPVGPDGFAYIPTVFPHGD